MNLIFCLIAKSGCGKNTIMEFLCKKLPTIHRIVPVTTRDKRPGEVDGKDYNFLTYDQFMKMDRNKELLEYRSYHVYISNHEERDNYYGYPVPSDHMFSILEGPYDMYENIINHELVKSKEFVIVPIYIKAPDEKERLFRMIERESKNPNPNYHEIARRFVQDNLDYPEDIILDICKGSTFINEDLTKCVEQIETYMKDCEKDFLRGELKCLNRPTRMQNIQRKLKYIIDIFRT